MPEPGSAAGPDEPRFFSLDDAERMLPLVRRIVEDIEEGFAELRELREPSAEVEERTAALNALIEELAELGCRFKGFREGLVDWYSYYAGRPVFLCWKLGEPRIEWWHQVDAGFAGRQPILDSQRGAFRAER